MATDLQEIIAKARENKAREESAGTHYLVRNDSRTHSIMLSAPHNAEQTRDGKPKYAERQTGTLAEIAALLGYPMICRYNNRDDDPNYDIPSPYKDDLVSYINDNNIAGLFDLHQLSPKRDMDLCLCTGNGENIDKAIVDEIAEIFREHGYEVTCDYPFSVSREANISRYVSKQCGIPTLQLEINTRVICEDYDETANLERFAIAMFEAVALFENLISSGKPIETC